LVEATALFKKL